VRLPETFFKSYFSENLCFVIDGMIYGLVDGKKGFRFHNRRFALDKREPITKLEDAYMERHGLQTTGLAVGGEHMDFLELVVNRVCKENLSLNQKKRSHILKGIVPMDFFSYNGRFYSLYESLKGEVMVKGKSFCLAKYPSLTVDEADARYRDKLARNISLGTSLGKSYYNESKRIGYDIIEGCFYAKTIVKPYVLYEMINRKHYLFKQATVCSELFKDKQGIAFSPLRVMEKYSHPSLAGLGKPMQKICVGDFSYDSIRNIGCLEEQIESLLRKGANLLTRGYRSRGKPYHFLTENHFQKMEVKNPDISLVSNV